MYGGDDDDDGYDSIDDEIESCYPGVKDPAAKMALRLKLIEEYAAARRAAEERAESKKRKAESSVRSVVSVAQAVVMTALVVGSPIGPCVAPLHPSSHVPSVDEVVDETTSESTEPPAKRQKKKGKPEPVKFYALEGVPALGTVVNGPAGYGEWRTVPGFSADKLRVSKTGFYQVSDRGRWLNPSRGTEMRKTDGTMRHKANVDEYDYLVYHLVLRAFTGPQPPGTTADHNDRNTSNNNADNLEWKTDHEQRKNQRTDRKAQSDGKPVRIRHKSWPIERGWESFENKCHAAEQYGLDQRAVGATANGDRKHVKGFYVEYLPAKESQQPLAIGDDSNLAAPPPADKLGAGPSTTIEEWRLAPGVTKLSVSTRGRVQTKDSHGNGWSYMRTPVADAGMVYARVTYKGKHTVVHRLVWMTFVGPIPEGMTIDHMIPSRKFDNRLSALRLATRSEQNINKDWKPISERSNSSKLRVRGRPADGGDDAWEEFEATKDAERVLHARFPDKKFLNGAIGFSAHAASEGKKAVRYGWVFEYV
ncbi:HNH endonuclease [bacterium]|nr:HNH endonuclease [bacterium]